MTKELATQGAKAPTEQKPITVQEFMRSDKVKEAAEKTLGKRSSQFIAAVISLANSNTDFSKCQPAELYNCCIKAAALNLSFDNNLGQCYIIPYKNNKLDKVEPQFQIGWRGIVQLALRSGKYARINVTDVREGELTGIDRMSGDMMFNWILDDNEREAINKDTKDPVHKVVGYVAYVRTRDNFEKQYYMTVEQLHAHANKYSQTYRRGYGVWKDDFDSMARKTVLKLLLSKFGLLTPELEQAIVDDQSDSSGGYPDNDDSPHFVIDGSVIGENEEDRKENEKKN